MKYINDYPDYVRKLAQAAGVDIPIAPLDRWDRPEFDLTSPHEYGGIMTRDENCQLTYGPGRLFGIRKEATGRMAWGLFSYDLDGITPEEVTPKLQNTGLPWGAAVTPNGVHIHSLAEYWTPDSPREYANAWRFDLLNYHHALVKVGLRPDPKHTWGAFLQVRCYIRLTPKAGAQFAFQKVSFVGTLPAPEPFPEDAEPHPSNLRHLAALALESMYQETIK